jgi:trans-AT polyketide synthase/acyltransferase/oxidoreductase domain-containing protein
MYSGQGSQHFAMGIELYEGEPVFRETFDEVSRYAQRWTGVSIAEVVYRHAGSRFDPFSETLLTHPALFAMQFAMDRLLRHRGFRPDFLLGYSLGEFVALTATGVLHWRDTIAALMHHAKSLDAIQTSGCMMAVLDSSALFRELEARFAGIELAAVNAPRHFVVTGPANPVHRAQDWLASQNVDTVMLPVSHAFHSAAVDATDDSLHRLMSGFTLGRIGTPVVSCAAGCIVYDLPNGLPQRITRWPIQFQQALAALEASGPKLYIDLGPSGTLASFVRQNLGPNPASEALTIVTPFAQDRRNLEALEARIRPLPAALVAPREYVS